MKVTKPYNTHASKKHEVTKMFDNIAPNYDLLNHTLSLGMDNYWRKKAIKKIKNNPKSILDIATGTGDFAITASKYTNAKIIAIDISEKMLEIGVKKVEKKNLTKRIKFQLADSEKLPFSNNSFDAITAGFGVRNFENLNKGLSEIYRTLKKGGIITILEPSEPKYFPLKQIYQIYFHKILPIIGGLVSKDMEAYDYLPKSVSNFDPQDQFLNKLKKVGFKKCNHFHLTFGIVSLYTAIK